MWLMSLFGLWEKRPWIYSSLLICRHVCRVGVKWIEKPGLYQPRSAGRTVQPFLISYPGYLSHEHLPHFQIINKMFKIRKHQLPPSLNFKLFFKFTGPWIQLSHIKSTSNGPGQKTQNRKSQAFHSPHRFFKRMLGRPNGSVCTHKN